MKPKVSLMIGLLLLQTGLAAAINDKNELRRNVVNEVNVAAAPETQALTAAWVEAFRAASPEARVNMITPDKAGPADIQIIAASSTDMVADPDAWKIVVGRDVIVPVMNEGDPCLSLVSGRGISPQDYAAILSSGGIYTWGNLLKTEDRTPVTVIVPGDRAALIAIARFASLDPGTVTATQLSDVKGLAALNGAKPGTIAFCRLSDITDRTGHAFVPGIQIVPVDVNGNAKSDYFEQFYNSFDSFNRGVYIGKYPKTLCSNIYAVSATTPAEGVPSDLIGFILLDGQRYVTASGFTALATGEGLVRAETLASGNEIITSAGGLNPVSKAWLWVLAVIVAVSLVAYAMYRITRAVSTEPEPAVYKPSSAFSLRSLLTPAGIMYDRSHAWTFMEKDGTVKVGIDDFLQHVTGSITRIRMKPNGDKVRKGEHVISVIQNGKKLDIQSPVSGTILARNERLMTGTGIINSSPYDEGWIYSVKPDNWEKESPFLITAGRYVEYLKDEFGRIRDFLAGMPGVSDVRLAHVVLQDGGEFRDGLLEDFGPEIWEEFQMKFLDQHR